MPKTMKYYQPHLLPHLLTIYYFFIASSSVYLYSNGRIFDISHRYIPALPVAPTQHEEQFTYQQLRVQATCAHRDFDAPCHVFDDYFYVGFDCDQLDLDILNGHAIVVDVPRDTNITAEVMKSLNIPKGTRRVLFKTLNTDSFVGFTEDGAKWVVENTDIKLVGTDYFSIATYDEAIPAQHVVFLKGKEIIPVQGLKLDGIQPGNNSVHCLPLRLLGADGAPTRCILIK
ncbi:hypothetical protein D8674_026441 [Pyrus ussuriensis x Pyrus communis]|uniref:Uncharacterized protein n=1 Tax=Pyrus ussuriensis x Pyrus communis TaxID=2448454 RepID=A0A5N5I9I3_9ROSA|nr:hypothetical protein D8674_026441 [Pyrus ussuriensis x Pyrus communis]